jgi:hypothetical protein
MPRRSRGRNPGRACMAKGNAKAARGQNMRRAEYMTSGTWACTRTRQVLQISPCKCGLRSGPTPTYTEGGLAGKSMQTRGYRSPSHVGAMMGGSRNEAAMPASVTQSVSQTVR